jgi:hypothetical protein
MLSNINLSNQELKIVNYLKTKSEAPVAWEELAQFSKDPTSVKLKTIQRSVSEIKKKFNSANLKPPFSSKFYSLSESRPNLLPVHKAQNLVQVKRTPAGNVVMANNNKHVAQIDFSLDRMGFKKVVTKSGSFQLNDNEWNMFKYFYNNPGRIVTISELRDSVVYPQFGSKLPARWFDSIMRTINCLRRQVFNLDKRLLTVKGAETSYLFQ